LDDPEFELNTLDALIGALFKTDAIDEVEPLVPRFREAAKAQSEKKGGFCYAELRSLLASARLHEVLYICTPRLGNLPHCSARVPPPKTVYGCHRLHRARAWTHALVEPSAVCRHAGGLKRPWGRCALCST
jgi:hypothetical protein